MQFKEYSARLGAHWLVALINGDESHLSDAESEQLNAFTAQYPCACFEPETDPQFCRDEISGMFAQCFETRIFVPQEKALP